MTQLFATTTSLKLPLSSPMSSQPPKTLSHTTTPSITTKKQSNELIRLLFSFIKAHDNMGKVHGSLARAGKVKSQTPKVSSFFFLFSRLFPHPSPNMFICYAPKKNLPPRLYFFFFFVLERSSCGLT